MKGKQRNGLGTLADVLIVGGWALLSVGVWRLNADAGMIVCGGLAILAGIVIAKGA
jgi:hypothetical protein